MPTAKADTAIASLWQKALPAMLMSSSDEEFDTVLNNFISDREKAGFAILQEQHQKEMATNLEKIANFPK